MKTTSPVSDMTAFNYVVFVPNANQVKFGFTRNIKRRIAEHRRLAVRAGFGDIRWSAMASTDAVAHLTETSLRQGMRSGVVPGHLEWVGGDVETYRAVIMATRRVQKQVQALFAGEFHAAA